MGHKKKIVFTVSNDLATDQRMIRLSNSLAQAGWSVLLIGREKPNSPPLKQYAFEQVRLKLPFHQGPLFYLFLNLALWRYLKKLSEDYLLANVDLDTLPVGWMLRRNQPDRWLYEAHEYFPEVPELQSRPWVKYIWLKIEQAILPKLKYVSTVSESVAQHFRILYPHLEVVVARNFPMQRFQIRHPSYSPRYLLYQGDLNEGRGIELAIEAVSFFNDLHLLIVGDGYLKTALEDMKQKSPAKDRIKFLGRIFPEELKTITDNAWVGINLLENKGLNYYYSLANKFGDYLQAGLPQINMNYPEYVLLNNPPVSELMNDYTTEDLIQAIINLEDTKYYQLLSQNAIDKRSQCNWENEFEKLTEWYASKFS